MTRAVALGLAFAAAAAGLAGAERAPGTAWPQWGGPARNFIADAPGLAASWPTGGPRRIWQRPLGDGFSAIGGERTFANDAMERFAHLLRERWRDRMRPHMRRMREMTTPNERDRSVVVLPSALKALYFLSRPFRLLAGAVARLRADNSRL